LNGEFITSRVLHDLLHEQPYNFQFNSNIELVCLFVYAIVPSGLRWLTNYILHNKWKR